MSNFAVKIYHTVCSASRLPCCPAKNGAYMVVTLFYLLFMHCLHHVIDNVFFLCCWSPRLIVWNGGEFFRYFHFLLYVSVSNNKQKSYYKSCRREAGDVWCLPPVWNLRAVIWFHFAISSLVLLPSPVMLSVLSVSACWSFLLNFFQKILQCFSLRDRLFCMAPV